MLNIWIGSQRQKQLGTSRYHLFYGLRKPLIEAIHAIFDNPMNDYMVLMWAARKAEGEHKQEKHNYSCASKSGMVNDVLLGNEGNTKPDPEDPSRETCTKWVEVQQQFDSSMEAVKVAQNALQKPPQQGSNQGQRNNNQKANNNGQRPQRKSSTWNNNAARSSQNPARGGNDWNIIQCYNHQGWGHMWHECSITQNTRPLNFRRGSNSRTSPQQLNRM